MRILYYTMLIIIGLTNSIFAMNQHEEIFLEPDLIALGSEHENDLAQDPVYSQYCYDLEEEAVWRYRLNNYSEYYQKSALNNLLKARFEQQQDHKVVSNFLNVSTDSKLKQSIEASCVQKNTMYEACKQDLLQADILTHEKHKDTYNVFRSEIAHLISLGQSGHSIQM